MGRHVFILLVFFIANAASANLQVELPSRSHGYFIGDVLVQRVNLDSPSGTVKPKSLETEQRIDTYLYRMQSEEITVGKKKWLELRYQIINAPLETETISLPSISFVTDSGEELLLSSWSFTVAPLTTSGDGIESGPLPDRRALDIIEKPSSKLLKFAVAALLATLVMWLLWWLARHFKDSHTLPFAKANRIIKSIPSAQRDSDPKAWVALHHAFNQVAGKTISSDSLAHLFATAPWINEYKGPVEEFYAASSARFYQQVESQHIGVADLCKSLHRTEKRQAKQVSKRVSKSKRNELA